MTGRARGALVTGLLLLVSLVAPNPVGAAASPLVVQSWSVAGDVSDPGAKSYYPQVAVSQDGTRATAVWYRNVGAKRVIESASAIISGNQATWGPVSTLSDQGLPLYPEVALSKDGTTAVAVWHFKTKIAVGVTWNIQAASASISGNTASWGTAQDISAPGGDATYAQVALSRDGKTAIAMWNRKAPGEVSYAQSATAAVDGNQSAWDGAVNASAPGADANYPQVAMSEDGTRATAVWTRKSAPDFWVQAASAEIGAGGTSWGPVAEVSARGVDQASSQVALSRDGSVGHALWSLPDGAGNFTVQSAAAAITGNTGTGPLLSTCRLGPRVPSTPKFVALQMAVAPGLCGIRAMAPNTSCRPARRPWTWVPRHGPPQLDCPTSPPT